MSFFSIIIPSYNRRDELRLAIRSVERQTFTDFDCWIYDDASTDGTREMLDAWALDPRFHRLRNETNRRQHYCRNRAIESSTSPWITFLDSDDVWLPRRLEQFHAAIQSNPAAEFWFSNGFWLSGHTIVGAFFEADRLIPTGTVPGAYAVGSDQLPYVTTNIAIARGRFQSVGLYREDMQILEDTELYARLFAAGTPVGVIRDPLSLYRLHPNQITRHYTQQYRESLMALKSGGASSLEFAQRSERLLRDTTVFLLKSGQGNEARRFLRDQEAVRRYGLLWLSSWIPAVIVRSLRALVRPLITARRIRNLPAAAAREALEFLRSLETEAPQ